MGPAGQMKSIGEITSILASVGTLFASIFPLRSKTEASLKISDTFALAVE